jgi:hypothetical protein
MTKLVPAPATTAARIPAAAALLMTATAALMRLHRGCAAARRALRPKNGRQPRCAAVA